MKNAIIVHGRPDKEEYYSEAFPSPSNFHWIPWLQKQLLIRDVYTATPEMPLAYAPNWEAWRKEFERYDVSPETILVGHSNGAGFLVRWLSLYKDVVVKKLILVAPSFHKNEHVSATMFDFDIDSNLASRASVTIFNGKKDSPAVHESVNEIMEKVQGVHLVEFENMAHFTVEDLELSAFPELLEEVLK